MTNPRKRKAPAHQPDAPDPPKKSKSRNGCLTCKRKRLKCDETAPTCLQCTRRKVACEGYRKEYKWMCFGQPSSTSTRLSSAEQPSPEQVTGDAPSLDPSLDHAHDLTIIEAARNLRNCIENESTADLVPSSASSSQHVRQVPSQPPLPTDDAGEPPASSSQVARASAQQIPKMPLTVESGPSSGLPSQQIPRIFSLYTSKSPPTVHAVARQLQAVDAASPSDRLSTPSDLRDAHSCSPIFPASDDYDESLGFHSYDPSTISSTWQSSIQLQHASVAPSAAIVSAFDDMDQEPGPFPETTSAMIALTRPRAIELPLQTSAPKAQRPVPTLAASNGLSRANTAPTSVASEPTQNASSPEVLLRRFERQTCGILSVKDGPSENPWRTLIWPLAQESPALYHAILSMSAFHGAKELPGLHTTGMTHMTRAIKRLASEIEHMQFDTALAIALALAFCEGWDSHVSTGVRHLVAARFLVNKSMAKHNRNLQQGRLSNPEAERLRFLCNTFVYMDVIARLTHSETSDVDLQEIMDTVNTSHEEMQIDPMMGCGMTLFPLLGRVATLIQRVRKTATNSLNIVSAAIELQEQLVDWELPDVGSFQQPEDPQSKVQHCVQTAEAYRQATLLYLHQAVPEIPSESTEATAKRILLTLASVPLSSRTTIIQIFPLFVASCEMTDPEDRDWVMRRWAAMIDRLQIGNLDSCWTVVQEVWNRRDVHRSEDVSRPHGGIGRGGVVAGRLGDDYTVRGKLHWLGVMKDWDWEVFL